MQFSANELQGGKGSGLGLWVSKGFVDRHGGQLKAYSEGIGHGSKFVIELPVYTSSDEEENSSSILAQKVEEGDVNAYAKVATIANGFDLEVGTSSSLPRADIAIGKEKVKPRPVLASNSENQVTHFEAVYRTVLVVDDSVSNRKMLCRILARDGFECTQAVDGQAAVDLVSESKGKYDMVLMDYEMPIMDGPTATKAIRVMDYTGPIIGVTGNVLAADRAKFIASGANEVLHKPLTLSALNAAMEALVL